MIVDKCWTLIKKVQGHKKVKRWGDELLGRNSGKSEKSSKVLTIHQIDQNIRKWKQYEKLVVNIEQKVQKSLKLKKIWEFTI